MSDVWVVVVAHNVVCAIERSDAAETVPETPLEVSTQLAANNQRNGCIDGRYCFHSAQRARIFASLCLEFTKALIDKRLAAIIALPTGAEYDAHDQNEGNGTEPRTG